MHFIITSKQHKTQGKEVSISYDFTILFDILVHYGVPHMACINDYMYITLMNVVTELHENIMQIICMIFYDKSMIVYCALNVFQLS